MMKIIFWLIGCILSLFAAAALHAQLILEKSVTAMQVEQYIRTVSQETVDQYIAEHGLLRTDGNESRKVYLFADVGFGWSKFAWRLKDGNIFYTSIAAFQSDLTLPPLCTADTSEDKKLSFDQCERAISGFRQCHLFVIDTNRKVQAMLPLHIPQPDFIEAKPSCFDIHAMAAAQVVGNGMLIVLGYYDSRWTCWSGPACASGRKESYPDPYYKTTLLVRFEKNSSGKLMLLQDDNCLPPLNKYNTITSARAALKATGCK